VFDPLKRLEPVTEPDRVKVSEPVSGEVPGRLPELLKHDDGSRIGVCENHSVGSGPHDGLNTSDIEKSIESEASCVLENMCREDDIRPELEKVRVLVIIGVGLIPSLAEYGSDTEKRSVISRFSVKEISADMVICSVQLNPPLSPNSVLKLK
jgi:hypothetical protein